MGKVRVPFDIACAKAISKQNFSSDAPSDEKYERELVRKAIRYVVNQELTPKQRQYVVMYYGERLSMPQIAERCGVSKSTVSRTVLRARKNIAERLKLYIKLRKNDLGGRL